jgi:hypothetical protein
MRSSIATALAWALSAAALAAAPVVDKKTDAPAAEKIRKELDKVISVDIDGQALNLAIEQLKEQTKINFVLDQSVLPALGMDPNNLPVVKLKLKEVKCRSVLRALLNPYNLGYAVVEDVVVVSTEEGAAQRQLRQRISIDLDKMDLSKALKQLARETGVNLVVDARTAKEAATTVTLQLDDVPLETAVRLMTESANLKTVRLGNVLFVTSKANAAELRADPDLNPGPVGTPTAPALDGLPPGAARPGILIGPAPAAGPGPGPIPTTPRAADLKPADGDKPVTDKAEDKPPEKPAPAPGPDRPKTP